MARTVQQIQADIDAVMGQAATGDTVVRNADGSEVQSRTEEQRQKALASLRAELALANSTTSGATSRRRNFLMAGDPGYR